MQNGIVLVTNKKHSKPMGKGHKINDKLPFLGGKYEHPQHNILSYRSQQQHNLLQPFIVRQKYNAYFSLARITNISNFLELFLLIFTHWPWYYLRMARWSKLYQILWICPRVPGKSFPKLKQLPSPAGKKRSTKSLPFPPEFRGFQLATLVIGTPNSNIRLRVVSHFSEK